MNKFMNLPDKYAGEDSKFLVINIPWEKDVTYGKGASKGPEEIIKASHQLEYFDIEAELEVFEQGIKTIDITPKVFEDIQEQILKMGFKDKFPVFLGGDHSITIPTVKIIESIKEDFDMIVFDSHADFFYSWNSSENNHRCVNRRLIDNHNILVIGLRSCDIEEFNEMNKDERINYIKANKFNLDVLKKQLSKLKKKIYISIDVDVFDPSFIRNTGTPEPGGLSWNNVLEALELIFASKNVLAADINEFAPNSNFDAEAYSLAKLVYKLFILKNNFSNINK
jgi:agmatinase